MTRITPDLPETSPPQRTTVILWAIAGLLLAAIVVVALYKAWPLLYPTLIEIAEPDPGCDLRAGPCEAAFASGSTVRFAIEPRTIPVVTPLRLAVEIKGLDAKAIEVDFAGLDMNMGYNRVALEQKGPADFEGQGTLPVCVRAQMDWEARVLVHTPDGILAAPFRFATYRD
jgi:hypothetical protein